jgi:hypothetical protein
VKPLRAQSPRLRADSAIVKAFVPRKNLWFYPDGSKKGAMFEKYRDAWWVMTKKK